MEENSELHMETDVSSTTSDVHDDQETPETHMNVVIVLEEVVEPGSSGLSSQTEDGVSNENNLYSELKLSPESNMQVENMCANPCEDIQMRDLNEKSSTTEQIQETSKDSPTSSKLQVSLETKDTSSNVINTNKDINEVEFVESNISSSPQINISQNSPVKETVSDKLSPIKVSSDRIKVINLATMEKLRTPTKITLVRTKPNVDSTEEIKSPIKVSPDRINTEFSVKVPTKVSLVRKRSVNLISVDEIKAPIKVSPEKSNAVNVDITKRINIPPKVSPDISNMESSAKTQSPIKLSHDKNNMDNLEKIRTTSKISLVRRKSVCVTSSEEIKTPTKVSPNKTDTTNIDFAVKTNNPTKVSLDITTAETTEKTKTPIKVSLTRTRSVHIISLEENPTKMSPNKTYTTKDLTEKKEPPTKLSPVKINAECLEKVITVNKDSTDNIIASMSVENCKSQNKECNENIINLNQESVKNINLQSTESLDSEKTKSPIKKYVDTVITNKENEETKKPQTTEKDKMKTPNKEILKSNVENKEDKKEKNSNSIIDICEKSNDSQTNSDISEKEHNKSISRELKSLIKSAKESKIISECTQLTSKTRKSRVALDSSFTSPNTSLEAEKIQAIRRSSNNSQRSNGSEKSEKVPIKRSMRSQNPEFVFKVKKFLNSVTGKNQKGESDDEEEKKENGTDSAAPSLKKKKNEIQVPEMSPGNKLRTDPYCWRCHWQVEQTANEKGHPPLQCTVCPRAFHFKCLSGTERNKINTEKSWVCPECLSVLHAESSETRSAAMKKISLGDLCELLHHALERMMDLNGVEAFMQPVDRTAFPDYDKYVVHPMDLKLMKQNITDGHYGSTEAFLADSQWILHNSIIFNTCMYEDKLQSKLTSGARALIRSCRAEMGEIEACPQCYAAAHARRPTWFIDVCSTPHILLWAKLKGFPYWPAKGMSVSSAGLVDVRFFGAHDRAWVPARDCFLFCEKDPNNFRTKRQDILDSMQEAELHIRNISRKFGKFVYPPFKTQFDPTNLTEQLKMMIPSFDGEILKPTPVKEKSFSSPTAKGKSRSNSKSSKSSFNDGDTSDNEDVQVTDIPARKMADGALIAKEDAADVCDKDKPMEVDDPIKEKEVTRKRRRSELEEAVLTIIETSNAKRPKLDVDVERKKKKPEQNSLENNVKSTENTAKEEDPKIEDPKLKDPKLKDSDLNAGGEIPKDKINEKVIKETTEVVQETPKVSLIKNNTNESVSEVKKTPTNTPIKVKSTRSSTPKEKDDKLSTPKQRPSRTDKSTPTEKDKQEGKVRTSRRGNSKNVSMNDSPGPKNKKTDLVNGKTKESNGPKNKESEPQKEKEKTKVTTDRPKTKNRVQFDDDTSLAVLAREVSKTNTGLPTISSVRSLSTLVPTETSKTSKNTDVTVIADSDSSIFTPTSTDNVRNMKEAVNKLEKLRSDRDTTLVGKVGVRAFARMKSPEKTKPTESVEVEIKSEPIDLDFEDADRQSEKLNLMNAFRLRPVNPPNLRGVRINKVVVSPFAKKPATKSPEVRVNLKAKKTFPTPRKVDDGRAELNSKNSMVYIPIQPPASQAPPVRPPRTITVNGPNMPHTVRPQVSSTSNASPVSTMNTVSSALVPTNAMSTPAVVSNSITNPIVVPTVGQMPFITSVNGQWTFSLQPVMSVGGIDGNTATPMLNGLPERNIPNNAVVPLATSSIQPTILSPIGQPLQLPPAQIQASKPNSNTEATPGEPPRLYQRPPLHNPLDSNTPQSVVPAPSHAGPLTAKLNQNAVKLTDFFKNLLEDSLDKIEEPASQVTSLKLQLEQMQWRHQQEVKELKHNHDLTISEMRASYEKAIARGLNDARRTAQAELDAAVKNAKSKQWCANCSQEAQFYCCWNTSYCDYGCQKAHWPHHYTVCTQSRSQDNNGNESGSGIEKRLHPAPDSLPRSGQTPTLTVGAKVTRPFQDPHQKTSIIVSMVEDKSGNPTVKCLGTYKPAAQHVQPVIINKQIMTSEETSKVVTSGGYLIVGAGTGSQSIVTSQRRQHTIQYFS